MDNYFHVFEKNLVYFDLEEKERELLCQKVRALLSSESTLKEILDFKARLVDKNNKEKFGDCENEVCFAAFLLAIEDMKEIYRKEGISQEVFLDTVKDIVFYCYKCFEKRGFWGNSDPNWTKLHVRGMIFRLGRLQFEKADFWGGEVLKNRETREEIMLPEDGVGFDEQGFMARDGEVPYVKAKLVRKDGFVCSNVYLSDGRAVFEKVCLDTKKWEYVLKKGDPVLSVHIPAGGKMDLDACRKSFERAVCFFSNYPYKAYVCYSWLLDVAFKKLLREDTNIRRFQDLFCLFPVQGEGKRALVEAFKGEVPKDFSLAPRDTSLQRALANFILAGGRLHDGGGYVLGGFLPWEREC